MKRNFRKSRWLHTQQCYLFKSNCHLLWIKQGYLRGNPSCNERFPNHSFWTWTLHCYGSSVGPVVIHTPPFLTQLCVLLVLSINRAQESLPEFVLMFCESLKRARPCLASLCALSLVFVVEGVPKLAHVCGRRELHWRLDGHSERRGQVSQRVFHLCHLYADISTVKISSVCSLKHVFV